MCKRLLCFVCSQLFPEAPRDARRLLTCTRFLQTEVGQVGPAPAPAPVDVVAISGFARLVNSEDYDTAAASVEQMDAEEFAWAAPPPTEERYPDLATRAKRHLNIVPETATVLRFRASYYVALP